MFPSYILGLREGIEAALIVGILLGALKKINREDLKKVVWGGVIAGVLASLFSAVVLNWIGAEFEGTGEMVFEGLTMLFAAGMLTWMIFWMQKQGKNMKQELEREVQIDFFTER